MLNKVILQGRLTADPELKSTPSGVSVAQFSLAVERDYKTNGNKETDFINIVAWRNTAEFASKYFGKGKMMVVVGRLEVRSYTAQDSSKRYVTEVIADNVYFGGDKSENAPTAAQTAQETYSNDIKYEEVPGDEDLPF